MDRQSDIVIGIPRAMLYHRYKTLWETFFKELGVKVKLSGATSKKTLDEGTAIAIDESCLSLKIFFGHVNELIGQCDYIFIPRIKNLGRFREFCTRFQSMYDLARNVFRDSGQKFIGYNVDVMEKQYEPDAFLKLGQQLGFTDKEIVRAYRAAKNAQQKQLEDAICEQDRLLKSDGFKVLIIGHSYMIYDSYIGKAVTDFLKKSDVIPIYGDIVDSNAALEKSKELSKTCKWQVSRELLGSIVMNRDKVDGIILLSAFPCGPDSMVNELIVRRVKDIPILNLVMDGQNGTAGVETRLESFIDIIRFKEEQFKEEQR